jgi:hypothetical protein
MNAWQNIFRQSRVNDGVYLGDKLPAQNGNGRPVLGFRSVYVISARAIATRVICSR